MVTRQVPEPNPFGDTVMVPSSSSPRQESLPNHQQPISATGAPPVNDQSSAFAATSKDNTLFNIPQDDVASTQAFISPKHTGASENAGPLRPQGTGASRAETNPFLRRKMLPGSQGRGALASTPRPENPPAPQLQAQSTGTNPWGNSLEHQPYPSFTGPAIVDGAIPGSFPLEASQSAPVSQDSGAQQQPPKLPERSLLDDDIQELETTFSSATLKPDQPESSPQPAASDPSSSQPDHLGPRSMVDEAVGPAAAADANPVVERYQIKKIWWYDASSLRNPRETPILVQNVNGPCPLLALVNVLTLTARLDDESTLVNTLASKEQISLDLLINAVIDEMMLEHRMPAHGVFPDPPALAAFLRGLHTGMNVNPRFIPTDEVVERYKRTSINLHPSERGDLIPGTFETSDELDLYATFGIDLIHGWLPEKTSEAYAALARQAANFEDASAKLFFEEELEGKLDDGLDPKEMEMYIDIQAIKDFFHDSGTQLTPWGIEVLRKTMKPGQFSIFFRNSHFSTLYCHPQTRELLALVTDAGYACHAEVVWESLADTTGHHTEYFSGDFRQVGGEQGIEPPPRQSSMTRSLQIGSQTEFPPLATGSHPLGNRAAAQSSSNIAAPLSPAHEQVDSDLALAMQLQDEYDEEVQRQEAAAQARRRRESQLSEQYLDRESRTNLHTRSQSSFIAPGRRSSASAVQNPAAQGRRPTGASPPSARNVPPRGISGQRQQGRTTLTPGPATNQPGGDDVPPPSYEQAASDPVFNPPAGHHAHPASAPAVGNGARPAQGMPFHANGMTIPRGEHGVAVGQRQKDKCLVM